MNRTALPILLLAACAAEDPDRVRLSDASYDTHPLVPQILRDVALVDDDAEYTQPFVPGHRTTMDGRLAIRVQGGTVDVGRLSRNLSFFLFVPERLEAPILAGPAGAEILAETEPFDVVFPPALDPDMFRLGHHAICDPTQAFAVPGERTNPYPCGEDTLDDCYDITVISSTSPGLDTQLWGTPVTVRVDDPKTAEARIVEVDLGEPVAGIEIALSTEWTEPAVTMDGRLLTGRLGRFPRSWTNPNTGETLIRPYDLAYALLPDEADPCDITGWTEFHPMSHAPYDPRMVGRYGLAAYPFRDTEGQLIPDGEDLGGTYPWVDREGANVFMTGMHGRIAEQSETQYPRRCVVEGCERLNENVDFDRGFMVGGLWTHGKFVHLDSMINSIDWAVGVTPQTHWWVDLYRDETGTAVPVRFGSGRFINAFRDSGPYPPGYSHNANILDSIQNLHNHQRIARPVTPRDIVWVMGTGVATDEVAFDDLLNPDALIVSSMTASITQLYDEAGASLAVPWPRNGQVRELVGLPGLISVYELHPEAEDEIHIQNGATTLSWEVPAYGWVEAGRARVEPVALGGVHGRGFFLSGDNAIHYAMPSQPALRSTDATIGLFVDPRAPEARELIRFPDDTGLVLEEGLLTYVRGDAVIREIALPASEGWFHLGLRVQSSHRLVTLLYNGMAMDRALFGWPVFSLEGGDLIVGRAESPWSGFRGWVDELLVLAQDGNPEVACNHARGTLIDGADRAGLGAIADRYPAWAHDEIAAAAGLSTGRFVCWVDYSADYAAHLGNLPEGSAAIREAINYPEGPLMVGMPRPDSSNNAFCLSCHTAEGQGGLSLEALAARPDLAEHDPRRQPSQPPRRVFGNIPANWIAPGPGPGGPPEAMQAPPEGLLVDRWVLPGSP